MTDEAFGALLTDEDLEALLADKDATLKSLQRSFGDFINVVYYAVNKVHFTFKPFHLIVIEALEDIAFQRNTKRNLGISLPVGSGKSLIVEYFIAWTFCRSINLSYVYGCHSRINILKLSREVKDIFSNEFVFAIFGSILKQDEKSKINWSFKGAMSRTGLVTSTMGSAATGADSGHPGIEGYSGALILDDPLDAGEITSLIAIEDVIRLYSEKFEPRRRTITTPSIVIMQRLKKHSKESTGDLIGWLKTTQPHIWRFIEIPAINEDGSSFWPERYPVEDLELIKNLTPGMFYSQYQQDPISFGGNIIKRAWFKYYSELPSFRTIFITGDTAQKIQQHNDFSVFGVWGVAQDGLYLLDLVRGKWEAPELRVVAKNLWEKWRLGVGGCFCTGFFIEDKTSGTGLIQELNRDGLPVIALQRGKGEDKLTRLQGVLQFIFAGKVILPKDQLFIEAFLAECEAFTRNDSHNHDDQVDVMIDAIMVGLSVSSITVEDTL